jgi:hypothetical protein
MIEALVATAKEATSFLGSKRARVHHEGHDNPQIIKTADVTRITFARV